MLVGIYFLCWIELSAVKKTGPGLKTGIGKLLILV